MKFVVIDDDPTGSQTVHDCLLLLKWDCSTLVKGFESKSNLFFILANTRSLSENDAKLTIEEICKNLKTVITSQAYEEEIIFISRGDSTLRGHNFLEPIALDSCLGPFDATFHIPAFIEGKRFTINGSHFVDKTPISQTIFAKDKIFGYETSNVKNLLFQQSKSQINFEDIQNLLLSDIEMLNDKENNIVFKTLKNLKNNKHVIVDVENYSQLKKFSLVIKKLIKQKKFLFRTAASFISSISEKSFSQSEIFFSNLRIRNKEKSFLPGLIIVGSYVELSTIQLNNLLDMGDCNPVELDVFEFFKIISSDNNQKRINLFKNKFLKEIRFSFEKGKTPVLFTSRKFMSLDASELFNFYNLLACFIAELVADLKYEIGYLISKGGITTNLILSKGLNADYVYLEGQILTGISVVSYNLKNGEKLPIVTHPGNIGTKDSLVDIWKVFENKNNF
ncbi:four-carbon acid sugar kinase family protein [uncultured Prochlorococcus sp.]|uniref:four-carbon acid sugar kinase family protein n=1 Tax=uncultured Prochlorococcus sp. TaxID=159733 RepID=UPI00258FDCFE|nr:four-carbon acid sugar kinase family protein [uncultured Prochlorococcus sp.]